MPHDGVIAVLVEIASPVAEEDQFVVAIALQGEGIQICWSGGLGQGMVDAVEVVAAGGAVAHPAAVFKLVDRPIGRCFGGETGHNAGRVAIGEGVGLPSPQLIEIQRDHIHAEELQYEGLHYSQLLAGIVDVDVSLSDPQVLLEPAVGQSGDPGRAHGAQVNWHPVGHFMSKRRQNPFT